MPSCDGVRLKNFITAALHQAHNNSFGAKHQTDYQGGCRQQHTALLATLGLFNSISCQFSKKLHLSSFRLWLLWIITLWCIIISFKTNQRPGRQGIDKSSIKWICISRHLLGDNGHWVTGVWHLGSVVNGQHCWCLLPSLASKVTRCTCVWSSLLTIKFLCVVSVNNDGSPQCARVSASCSARCHCALCSHSREGNWKLKTAANNGNITQQPMRGAPFNRKTIRGHLNHTCNLPGFHL